MLAIGKACNKENGSRFLSMEGSGDKAILIEVKVTTKGDSDDSVERER
jgi:hypothetical protein